MPVGVGDRVQTNGTVNVRQSPAGTILGTQSSGRSGTVVGGPTVASLNGTTYTWFKVDFDSGVDGWVADIGLVSVPGQCDIVVQSTPTISPSPVTAGNSITVSYVIRNNGPGGAATSQTKIQIKNSSGSQITSRTFSAPSINAYATSSQSNSVTIPAGTPAGTYTAYVILDNLSELNQSNTSNDFTPGVNFTVSAPVQQSDIVVRGVPTISPNPVTAGDSITVSYVIHNGGAGGAGTSQTKIQIKNSAGSQITSRTFSAPAIGAGSDSATQASSLTIPAGSEAGTYTAYVILDNLGELNQSNTSNDFTPGVNFTVSAPAAELPNLVPQNITLDKSSVQAGGTLTINWTLANTGSGNSPGTVTGVRLNQSSTSYAGTTKANVPMPALSANSSTPQTATIEIPAGTAAGTYYVWIIADNVTASTLQQSNYDDDYAHSSPLTVTGSPAGFNLSFPLAGQTHLSASINSVFDHSMTTPYTKNDVVVAYNGERGERQYGWDGDSSHPAYKNSGGTAFVINGHYAGAGAPTFLNYDGHPGIDYRAASGTPVYATADGTVHYPNSIPGLSGASSYNTIEIDHGNGYKTYYLHCSTHPSSGNAIVPDGSTIHRGEMVARSGEVGAPGAPHLHVEVHRNGVPVDPYGWEGAGADPYTAATNERLWQGSTTTTVIHGIDVSHYQNEAGPLDWSAVFNSGQKRFVFIKSGESFDYPDGTLDQNVQAARAANLLVGAYHLLRPDIPKFPGDPNASAVAEAQYFLSRSGTYVGPGYLPPALDIEPQFLGGLSPQQLSQWVRAWLQYVKDRTGVTPIIYTTRAVLRDYIEDDLETYPLWIATNDGDETGTPSYMGTSWPNWKFKQYRFGENGGTSPGITGPVDLDSFNGDLNALQALANVTPTAATPTFSPDGGGFTGPVQVSIACATTGATIRYTTDGLSPTSSSPVYTAPLTLTSTATVKARAFAPGYNASAIASATFTVNTASVSVTVQTNPSGRSFTVDGTAYTAAQNFTWVVGSSHTIGTTSPQSSGAGQYVWKNWSDGKAISHSVTAPNTTTTYTATFTPVNPPTVTTTAATAVTSTSAALNGSVNPNAAAASAWFEWGTSPSLSTFTKTAAQSVGSGTAGIAISSGINGLAPNTTYYFRVAASNSGGTSKGSILSFSTASATLPSLKVTNTSVSEATATSAIAVFTVSLYPASSQTVTVQFATSNVSATAPGDYLARALSTLTFLPGETSKTVNVVVLGDAYDEPNETFRLLLSNPTGATIASGTGTCTILDNDLPPKIAIGNVTVTEPDAGVAYMTFTVRLSARSGRHISVKYATSNGTATAGPDYTAVPLTSLIFQPGELTRTFRVAVRGDTSTEPNETFFVNLSQAVNATISDSQGLGTILNDD